MKSRSVGRGIVNTVGLKSPVLRELLDPCLQFCQLGKPRGLELSSKDPKGHSPNFTNAKRSNPRSPFAGLGECTGNSSPWAEAAGW